MIRYFLVMLCLIVALISTNTMAQPTNKEECLGKICLGQSIHTISNVDWLKLDEVRGRRWEAASFPYYPAVRVSLVPTKHDYSINRASIMLLYINNLSNAGLLEREVRHNSEVDALEVGRDGMQVLKDSERAVFCEDVKFASFYRSSSGHPTVVVFTPVVLPSGGHDLVVTQIERRIQIRADAISLFESSLRKDYPSLKTAKDLKVKCDSSPTCENETLGKSKAPTRDTASEEAMLRGKDSIIYLEWNDGYVDFVLQLFDPNSDWYSRLRALNPNPGPRIPDRFDRKSLTQHPLCRAQPFAPPLD